MVTLSSLSCHHHQETLSAQLIYFPFNQSICKRAKETRVHLFTDSGRSSLSKERERDFGHFVLACKMDPVLVLPANDQLYE